MVIVIWGAVSDLEGWFGMGEIDCVFEGESLKMRREDEDVLVETGCCS